MEEESRNYNANGSLIGRRKEAKKRRRRRKKKKELKTNMMKAIKARGLNIVNGDAYLWRPCPSRSLMPKR